MPTVHIVDLDSPPAGCVVSIAASATRTGNVISPTGEGSSNISLSVTYTTPDDGTFNIGDLIIFKFSILTWGAGYGNRYLRVFARAGQPGVDASGRLVYGPLPPEGNYETTRSIGTDANDGVRTNAIGDYTLYYTIVQEGCNHFYVFLSTVGYDWARATVKNCSYAFTSLAANYVEPTDPYAPVDPSTTAGGTGSWLIADEPVDFPTLPTLGAYNAGLVSIWTPTEAQIRTFAAWLWNTDPTTWGFWQKLITSPLDLIFGLAILPIPVTHPSADPQVLTLGWINTHCTMDYIDQQFIEVDMGTCDVDEYGGTYMDYVPYTKLSLYLPYIGVREISANDCMGKTLSIHYNIDVVSGACVAIVKADDKVLYHYMGNCAVQIPLSSVQMQDVVRNVISTAISIGVAATGAGAAATAAGVVGAVNSSVDAVMSGPDFTRSGNLGSNAGILDLQFPYLIRTTPRLAIPDEQNKYTGYPSFITEQLGDLEGYTEVEIIHLHNLTCTDEEAREIDSLLREGVIF